MLAMLMRGLPTVETVTSAGGVATIDLTPPEGEVWVVAWAQGLHDDGVARVLGFTLNDGVAAANIGPGASIAAGICLPLYATNPDGVAGKAGMEWALPLTLNHINHLTLTAASITAGKHVTINALVYRYRGFGPWSNV